MITKQRLTKEDFFNIIDSIEYREQDITEAKDFGCSSIRDVYLAAMHKFARYFVVYEDDIPVVTVMLQRDGHIVFFISKYVKHHIAIIRFLRSFAMEVVECCGPIITKTANWYTEARRLNDLIGFKLYYLKDKFGIYVLEN